MLTVKLETRYGTLIRFADVEEQNEANLNAPVLPEVLSLTDYDGVTEASGRTFVRNFDSKELIAVYREQTFDWGRRFRLTRD
jgi:hypothetical protein